MVNFTTSLRLNFVVLVLIYAVLYHWIRWKRPMNITTRTSVVAPNSARRDRINFPIVVVGLSHTGTTSMYAYFQCGGLRSIHFGIHINRPNEQRLATCIRFNIRNHAQDPLLDCKFGKPEPFQVFSDLSEIGRSCYDVTMWDLEALYQAHPRMTLVLTQRDPASWAKSISGARHFDSLLQCPQFWPEQPVRQPHELTTPVRNARGQVLHLPNQTMMFPDDLILAFEWHRNHVRQFAVSHPSITLLEFDIQSNSTGKDMEEVFGIDASCWGHRHDNSKKLKMTNAKEPQDVTQEREEYDGPQK